MTPQKFLTLSNYALNHQGELATIQHYIEHIQSGEKWHDDFKAWLEARRDKEQSFLDKGHLSEESLLVAKVLVMRYNEVLEWL